MRHLSLILILGGLLFAGISQGASGISIRLHEITDSMDGHRLVLFLRDTDITASPSWSPAEGDNPPMSIGEALTKLRDWTSKDSRYADLQIHEIKLTPIHEYENKLRWYYLIQVRPHKHAKGKPRYFAVMFNGAVVPAITEPESIK